MRLLLCGWMLACALTAATIETEVKAVLSQQQEAWNRGDLIAFMDGYVNSPDITFAGKQVTRGWDGTLERYRKTYPNRDAMGRLTFSEIEVRPLGKDHALVLGRFHLARATEGGGNASGRYTLVMTRTKQGWKALHDHTSAD